MALKCGHPRSQMVDRIYFQLLNRPFDISYDVQGSTEEIICNALKCIDVGLSLPTQISSYLRKK